MGATSCCSWSGVWRATASPCTAPGAWSAAVVAVSWTLAGITDSWAVAGACEQERMLAMRSAVVHDFIAVSYRPVRANGFHRSSLQSPLCEGPPASNGELLDRDSEEQEQEHCDCESDHHVLHSRCAVDVRTPLSDAAYASEWDKQPRRGDEMPWRGRRVPSHRLVCVAPRSPLGASRRTGTGPTSKQSRKCADAMSCPCGQRTRLGRATSSRS